MMRRKKFPAARVDGLLVERVGGETVVYETLSKEVHCLSPIASAVFDACDGRTTVEGVAEVAGMSLGEPLDVDTVHMALAQLEERNLLAFPMEPDGGMSRRDMIRRSAAVAGGAAMAPLITSVMAPPAIAASSATCANLICCPCCTISSLNKEDCCENAATVNCQCTNGSRLLPYTNGPAPNNCAKYCKPSGNSAPSDADCAAFFTDRDEAVEECGALPSVKPFAQCEACAGCPS